MKEIQAAHKAGSNPLEDFGLPTFDALLVSNGATLIDAAASLLGLSDPTALLWAPKSKSGYRVAERHLPFIRSIESPSLRIHIGAFFQNYRDAPAGALFVDEPEQQIRQQDIRAMFERMGQEWSPPVISPPFDHASWDQCPCDGHGCYGSLMLKQL